MPLDLQEGRGVCSLPSVPPIVLSRRTLRSAARLHPRLASSAASHCWAAPLPSRAAGTAFRTTAAMDSSWGDGLSRMSWTGGCVFPQASEPPSLGRPDSSSPAGHGFRIGITRAKATPTDIPAANSNRASTARMVARAFDRVRTAKALMQTKIATAIGVRAPLSTATPSFNKHYRTSIGASLRRHESVRSATCSVEGLPRPRSRVFSCPPNEQGCSTTK